MITVFISSTVDLLPLKAAEPNKYLLPINAQKIQLITVLISILLPLNLLHIAAPSCTQLAMHDASHVRNYFLVNLTV
jgi:hypothetical protein